MQALSMKAARPVAGKLGAQPVSGSARELECGRRWAPGARSPSLAERLPLTGPPRPPPLAAARRSVVVRAEEAAAPAAAPKKPDVGPKRGTQASAAAAAGGFNRRRQRSGSDQWV